MALSKVVQRLREAKKWSQQQLAFETGLSMSVISQIERGINHAPRLPTLKALARALGVSIDVLAEMDQPEGEVQPEAEEPKKPRGRPRKGGGE
jgi:transcriptional regulator with XRE-family HTH domain